MHHRAAQIQDLADEARRLLARDPARGVEPVLGDPVHQPGLKEGGYRRLEPISGRDVGAGTHIEYAFVISRYKQTQENLRANDDCQTFLLKLSDAIRPLTTAAEI